MFAYRILALEGRHGEPREGWLLAGGPKRLCQKNTCCWVVAWRFLEFETGGGGGRTCSNVDLLLHSKMYYMYVRYDSPHLLLGSFLAQVLHKKLLDLLLARLYYYRYRS